MVATTDQKARLLDLTTGVLELIRDGKRDIMEVLEVFQIIKDAPNFAAILGRNDQTVAAKPVGLLLSVLGIVNVPATTEEFVPRENFKVTTGPKAKVQISWLGDNFKDWFFGKTEEPMHGMKLRYAKLMEPSVDAPILKELGDKAETTLAQVYALMERQKNGEDGVLLTNGWANVFYVLNINGELCAVDVSWDGDGWSVRADSVAYPVRWHGGFRVFSRNS